MNRSARMRLRTELLIATLAIICGLIGALLLMVRHLVRSEIGQQVQASTYASLRAFENVQRQRDEQLSRISAVLAELPTLKALMTTQHPATIQDGSDAFWKLAGSDLFILADSLGNVMGFHVARPGWERSFAERDLKRSVESDEDSAWWYEKGQLYRVFIQPITAGNESRPLGVVAVGYQVDSTMAEQLAAVSGSNIVLATGNSVIASTLPTNQENDLRSWIGREGAANEKDTEEIKLGSEKYRIATVLIHSGEPAPVRCYVLVSMHRSDQFLMMLNRSITVLGISAVLLAAFLLTSVSRTITRPLDNLVAGVRALAAGDYAYSITPRGSSEVAELGEAFSKMRRDLLAAQERWLTTERVAALGLAASSISHDLRHYLAAVVANAEFLYEAEKLKLNRDEIYEEIKMASDQMTDLLDSFRELARADGTISPVSASIDKTIRFAVEAVLARAELRTRTVSIQSSGDMDGVFDTKKIERLFFNLVLNACEAAPQFTGKIHVEIASNDEEFEIRVSDNGSGIPQVIIDKLFDPFVSMGKPNGTGLGLAIVNKIVQDHDGTISVERTSNEGTVFLVRLPRYVSPVRASSQAAVH